MTASFVQDSFRGGEWSKAAQGRITRHDYRTAMNVCLNGIPIESEAWVRRGGTRHCAEMRGRSPGRAIAFDFNEPFPYTMLFTDDYVRFLSETQLVGTNDDARIASISSASPAVIATQHPHGWTTGATVLVFSNVTQLMNRPLAATVLSSTTFSVVDIAGTPIDGASLDAFTFGTVRRVHEVATTYHSAGAWANLRSVQAGTTAILLNGTLPQILTVTQEPSDTAFAQFAMSPADFIDGPYLDPIPGSYITASGLSGVVTLTLSFQPYSASTAYSVGDYVTYAGQGYRSIAANNQNNQPDFWPSKWRPVNAGDPINDRAGFTAADIGRLVRLFSEPPLWDAGATYAAGQVIAYAASGNAIGYYLATASISPGTKPGTSLSWSVVSGASVAIWTWGRILSISASGVTAPNSTFGNLSGGGGVGSAFDGNASKAFASSANAQQATPTAQQWSVFPWSLGAVVQYGGIIYRLDVTLGSDPLNYALPPVSLPLHWTPIGSTTNVSFDEYVGGHLPAPTQIASATITPPIDTGFTNSGGVIQVNLRAKATAPTSPSDGTLIGTTGIIANTTGAVSIVSSDQATAWNYVWAELIVSFIQPLPDDGSHSFTCNVGVSQVQLFSPNIANGSVISVQIAGDPLLYTNACRKWRLGAYGGSNGFPKNGTYNGGRVWLSGVLGNRIDSSKSNVIRNDELVLNMAPTAPDGTVADDSAISLIFAGKDVNQIFWLEPDQQGIIAGTQAGEWLIFAPGQAAMSPTNIDARRVTKIGCANIEPRRTDHTLVMVQKFKRKIQEYFADIYSGKFSAPNLLKQAKHISVPGIEELAYQQELAPVVWGRLANGALIGVTYARDTLAQSHGPNINAAHRHTLGSGRAVRSICVGGSSDGNLDSLYMVTEEATGGGFHAEIMTNLLDEGFGLTDCWFLDNGIVPAAFAIDTTETGDAPYGGVWLYGLWPHEGKTVAAWLAGLDCGSRGLDSSGTQIITDFTVSGGKIFVPFGDGISQGCGDGLFTQTLVTPYVGATALPMAVGFPFVSDGQIVRPAQPQESGSAQGPSLGMLRKIAQYAAQLYGCVTGTIYFGTRLDTAKLLPAYLKDNGGTKLTTQQLFDGVHRATLEANSDKDNMICWRVPRPHPAFVAALGGYVKTEGV